MEYKGRFTEAVMEMGGARASLIVWEPVKPASARLRPDQRAVAPNTVVERARALWYAGAFEECAALLEPVSRYALSSEAALLSQRALLRLGRPAQALEVASATATVHDSVDARSTAKMLYASAYARAADPTRGLSMLEDANRVAAVLGAHRTILAEIAYHRAYALWLLRRYDEAREIVGAADRSGADIIDVHHFCLLGFIEIADHDFESASAHFLEGLAAYHRCRARDVGLEASMVHALATFVCESGDASLIARVREYAALVPWTASVRQAHLQTLRHLGWALAIGGDELGALRFFRDAELAAPTDAWRAMILADRGTYFRRLGESRAAGDCVRLAASLAERVAWNDTVSEERLALLEVAEALAPLDASAARGFWETYRSLGRSIDATNALSHDRRLEAYEAHVHGIVALHSGDGTLASERLAAAWRIWREIGYTWHAIETAVTLYEWKRHPWLLEYLRVAGVAHRDWVHLRLPSWARPSRDPELPRLTRSQRDVYRLLITGKTNQEIATALDRKTNTIKNHVHEILTAFKVRSRSQLLAKVAERV